MEIRCERVLRNVYRNVSFGALFTVFLALGLSILTLVRHVSESVGRLGVDSPSSLCWIYQGRPDGTKGISMPTIWFLTSAKGPFESIAAYVPTASGTRNFFVRELSDKRVDVLQVTANFFSVLGTKPLLGRLFESVDGDFSQAQSILISEHLWKDGFGSKPGLIGSVIHVDDLDYTVVGIIPDALSVPESVDAWLPLPKTASWSPSDRTFRSVARLRRGASLSLATRYVESRTSALRQTYPSLEKDTFLATEPFLPGLLGPLLEVTTLINWLTTILFVLLGATLVLMIILRDTRRSGTAFVQVSLGQSITGVVQEYIAESAIYVVAGTALALSLSFFIHYLFAKLYGTVLVQTLGIATSTSFVCFSSLLVWTLISFTHIAIVTRSFRGVNIASELAGNSRTTTGTRLSLVLRSLMIVELSAAVALLTVAFYSLVSVRSLENVQLGFDPKGLSDYTVYTPRLGSMTGTEVASRVGSLLEHVRSMPGVTASAAAFDLPLQTSIGAVEFPSANQRGNLAMVAKAVSPSYFQTLRIPILAGSDFSQADMAFAGSQPIVVSETAVRGVAGSPRVGSSLKPVGSDGTCTVRGVVGSVHALSGEGLPLLYIPFTSFMSERPRATTFHVFVRGSASDKHFAEHFSQAVGSFLPAGRAEAPKDLLEESVGMLREARLQVFLAGVLGLLALAVSIFGLYSVVSFDIDRQNTAFLLRLAFGASVLQASLPIIRSVSWTLAIALPVGSMSAYVVIETLRQTIVSLPSASAWIFPAGWFLLAVVGALIVSIATKPLRTAHPAYLLRKG